MANQNSAIDNNYKKTLLGVTDDASAEIRRILVDPTTGRLKCSATVTATFLSLSDTPSAYTGQSGKVVAVKATEDGLEFTASPVFTTQITTPLIIGGTATTSDLTLQTTSGIGAAGADMHFLVGNNGATEAMTILNNGNVGIGTTSPTQKLEIEQGHLRFNQIATPSAPTVAIGAAGVLTGNYYYRISFVTALGETETGNVSALVAPAAQQVDLSAIPVGGTGVTARKIYRTTAGGANILMKLVATISDNVTTVYTDNIADGSLGVSESRVNTTGGIGYNGTVRMFAADPAVTILGYNAGRVNTGHSNSFMGTKAGYLNTTGYSNSFMGTYAGNSNTTGHSNSFMGTYAGYLTTTGYSNSFMGTYAGNSNTTGHSNSFIGMQAGYLNTTGYRNSFIGMQAGNSNTTGYYNSFIGMQAGYSNTTGHSNSFMGANAGYLTTTGYSNSFMGTYAGNSNTTGHSNSFMGTKAGYLNTTGYYNSFIGMQAGNSNTTGSYNSFMGTYAGLYLADGATANQTSNTSVFLGYDTRAAAVGGTNEIVIGASTIGNGSNTVTLGNTSITKTILQGNVGIGTAEPTAVLHLKAGTATANTAPIKLTAGTVNTTPEAGAIEFDGTDFFLVI